MESLAHLSEAQRLALDKPRSLIRIKQNDYIVAHFNARLEAFMQFEATLFGQVHDHVTSVMPTCQIHMPVEEAKALPLVLSVKTFKENEE